jgi:hypothetical protein
VVKDVHLVVTQDPEKDFPQKDTKQDQKQNSLTDTSSKDVKSNPQ